MGWVGFLGCVAGVKPLVPMRDDAGALAAGEGPRNVVVGPSTGADPWRDDAGALAAGEGPRNVVVGPSTGADPLRPTIGRGEGAGCGAGGGAKGERR